VPRESRTSAVLISDDWLLKTEAAYFHGVEFLALPGEKESRLEGLLGAR